MRPIRIALVGYGRVAQQDHAPALSASTQFELAAVVEPQAHSSRLPVFGDIDELVTAMPGLDAVAICTPPQVRYDIAARAIHHGLHTLLEKPPCTTVAGLEMLAGQAAARRAALFATWYARYSAAVAPARDILRATRIRSARVTWHEDVREWHPGHAWLWTDGGFGAFDPGINALSLLTTLLPGRLELLSSQLFVPANRAMPAAVRLQLATDRGVPIEFDVDMLRPRTLIWDIAFETDAGRIVLSEGGAKLSVDDIAVPVAPSTKYEHLYARFAELVRERAIDADGEPLRIAEEALAGGARESLAPFHD